MVKKSQDQDKHTLDGADAERTKILEHEGMETAQVRTATLIKRMAEADQEDLDAMKEVWDSLDEDEEENN